MQDRKNYFQRQCQEYKNNSKNYPILSHRANKSDNAVNLQQLPGRIKNQAQLKNFHHFIDPSRPNQDVMICAPYKTGFDRWEKFLTAVNSNFQVSRLPVDFSSEDSILKIINKISQTKFKILLVRHPVDRLYDIYLEDFKNISSNYQKLEIFEKIEKHFAGSKDSVKLHEIIKTRHNLTSAPLVNHKLENELKTTAKFYNFFTSFDSFIKFYINWSFKNFKTLKDENFGHQNWYSQLQSCLSCDFDYDFVIKSEYDKRDSYHVGKIILEALNGQSQNPELDQDFEFQEEILKSFQPDKFAYNSGTSYYTPPENDEPNLKLLHPETKQNLAFNLFDEFNIFGYWTKF